MADMKPRDKKLSVLKILSQEATAISLSVLIDRLEAPFNERTIRRWLAEMIEEGLVEKIGDKRSAKYRISSKSRENNHLSGTFFSSNSLDAIEYVRKPIYQRKPTGYDKNWVESYITNHTYYLPSEVRLELEQAGIRANHNSPAGTYAHKIYHRLLIDLSYNSSRLEGNTYTLLDTKKLILSGEGAKGKLNEEKVMILNHKEAIRYLVENAPRLQINDQTIYTIHYLLSDGLVEPKYAGKTRDHWVRIGGSTYIPLEGSDNLQKQIQLIAKKADQIQDPFEQSLFLLIHISYLQAFADVNKRTARLCCNIPFIIKNLVPLSFNDIKVDDYMSAMIAVYELQDTKPIADLFVFSYLRTCAAYDATVQAIHFDEVRVRYREKRRKILREIISQNLTGAKMEGFIVSETQKEIPKSDQSAFIKDVKEDLEQMDASRIAGLGVTLDELNVWIKGV